MNNKYFYGSHLTERKFRQIIKLFCIDMEAKKVAEITGVSRQSINRIFNATIYIYCSIITPFPTPNQSLSLSII